MQVNIHNPVRGGQTYRMISGAHPSGTTFAKRFKTARLAAGLSQKKLAPKAGCSRTLIITIEQGKTQDISANLAFALADAMNVNVRWLVTGYGTSISPGPLDVGAGTLLTIYKALPAPLQEHLIGVAQSLASATSIAPSKVSPLTGNPHPIPRHK